MYTCAAIIIAWRHAFQGTDGGPLYLDKIYVQGGTRLEGKVRTSGSKNATLAIMAGAVLAEGEVILRNVPRISDTYTMV